MSIVDQLKELKQLFDEGILSEEEFKTEKAKLMSESARADVEKDRGYGSISTSQFVDTIKGTAKNVSARTTELVEKIPTEELKQKSTSKNGMIIGIVVGVIALLIIGGLSINWLSNSDYRAAMKSADSYLVAGKYGDAEEQYKKAHELNATDKSLKYYDYAQELSQVWIKINDGEFDYDNAYTGTDERRMYDRMVSETASIHDNDVKKAFEDTTKAMENRAGY